jgi:hypothetical protein
MKPKILIGLILFLISLFSFGVSLAQDPGDPDTLRLANISGEIGTKASMPVFLYNDEELVSAVIPLLLDGYSGWLKFDSVSYAGSRLSDPTILDNRQAYVFGTDIFTFDSLLLFFSVSSGNSLPAGTGKLCDLWFTLHFGGEVLVDSSSDSPQGRLSLTDTNKGSFTPQFLSGLIDISCDYLVGDVVDDGVVNSADIVMWHKIYFYDSPWWDYPVLDKAGRFDLNCDRRLDMRDLVYLTDMLFYPPLPACTCGTINPPLYDDPGLPDTVWVESNTLIVGIPSTILLGIVNDEPLTSFAIDLEWDGSAVLGVDYQNSKFTDRVSYDNILWTCVRNSHINGVNPDTFQFYGWRSSSEAVSLEPDRDAVVSIAFIPQSAGTVNFRLTTWRSASESMLTTEDHEAILPTFYGGNITVLPYLAGDPNHDGTVNSSDIVYLINYLFKGGPQPDPLESGDMNCDEEVNSADVVYLINYLFKNGPVPCAPPMGFLTDQYGCKEFQKGTVIDATPPDQDCMEYEYDGESVLLLKHVNAGFNCCPEIAANITIEDNIITIEEIEISGDCDCLCLFDIDYEIRNLPPGEYTITAIEPYVPGGEEILEFTVDLVSSPSGSFCVYRDYYPWGIR